MKLYWTHIIELKFDIRNLIELQYDKTIMLSFELTMSPTKSSFTCYQGSELPVNLHLRFHTKHPI
jgi:hypothetical protein